MELYATWIIGILVTITSGIAAFNFKQVFTKIETHDSQINDLNQNVLRNQEKILANSQKDDLINDQMRSGLTDLKEIILTMKIDIIENLKKYEETSNSRLNSHSKEIKDLIKRITQIESKR